MVPPVSGAGVAGVVVPVPVPSVSAGAVSVGAGAVVEGSGAAGSIAAGTGSTTLVDRSTLKAIAARITAARTRKTSHMLVCEYRV
ncbi:MAG: hypothetical protein WAT35_16750 [Tabrizicola sp.]|nr:hypothetical protein [Tabrizicola sp.]